MVQAYRLASKASHHTHRAQTDPFLFSRRQERRTGPASFAKSS